MLMILLITTSLCVCVCVCSCIMSDVLTRHLRCVVSPPIIMTKCTDEKHGNYDLTIIILWNNYYNLNFNVGLSGDSKK